jgi:hypothetical protein
MMPTGARASLASASSSRARPSGGRHQDAGAAGTTFAIVFHAAGRTSPAATECDACPVISLSFAAKQAE